MAVKPGTEVSAKHKDSVFGYIRSHEKENSISAPSMIKYLILNYYLLTDKFEEHNEGVVLHKQGLVAKVSEGLGLGDHAMFGSLVIHESDAGISEYAWSFKLIAGIGFTIGLTPYSGKQAGDCVDRSFWGISATQDMARIFDKRAKIKCWLPSKIGSGMGFTSKGEMVIDRGDTVQMRLDMKTDELSFHCNGKSLAIDCSAGNFKNKALRMRVELGDFSCYQQSFEIELVEFAVKFK